MANVWVGDNYYITNIYVTDSSRVEDNVVVAGNNFLTILQRLPESSYPLPTEVAVDTLTDDIASDLSDDALIAALLPKINTALATDDASERTDGHRATALDNYTVKI